jgi:hypothetical protein
MHMFYDLMPPRTYKSAWKLAGLVAMSSQSRVETFEYIMGLQPSNR